MSDSVWSSRNLTYRPDRAPAPLRVISSDFFLDFHAILGGLRIEQIVQVGVPYVFDARIRGRSHHRISFA